METNQNSGGVVRRIVNHKSQNHHYDASACIVWCLDARFSDLYDSFLKRSGWNPTNVDLVRIAGGAKDLASPAKKEDQDFVLDQIGKSIKLHKTPAVVLMVHSECGAYGKHFDGDQDEQKFYFAELKKARDTVRGYLDLCYPETKISSVFADFEGLIDRG